MRLAQIGVQLYTLRSLTATDMPGTLRQLAALGFHAVEFAGYGSSTPGELRALLDELGLRAPAAHVGLDQWDRSAQQVCEELVTLGCQYAVVPWVAQARRESRDQAMQLAERLMQLGATCREHGLRLVYHHHDFEFAPLAGGSTLWEVLTTMTDATLIDLEIDVYWAQFAGHDPAALLRQFSGRVPLLHCKDMAADAQRAPAPVGEGLLDWPDILGAAREAGVQWYLVEQDHPQDALDEVRRALEYLRERAEG